jgi:hypothetical protein
MKLEGDVGGGQDGLGKPSYFIYRLFVENERPENRSTPLVCKRRNDFAVIFVS